MRYRHVSLYVEWADEAEPDAVRALLRGRGVEIVGVDWETDLKRTPGLLPRRGNAVFRFRAGRKQLLHEFMSAVAMLPGVYSVSEIRRFF